MSSVLRTVNARRGRNDCKVRVWYTYRNFDKNSSGHETANVNFLRRYRTRTSKYQKKENLLRLTNYTIARQVLRIKS